MSARKAPRTTKSKPAKKAAPKKAAPKKAAPKKAAPKKAAPKKAPSKRPAAKKASDGADAAFDAIGAALAGTASYRENRNSLNVNGKVFAMMVKGHLVVKLPPERIASLVAAGVGRSFEMGGRVMREWVSVAPGEGDWQRIAREALAFVAGATSASR